MHHYARSLVLGLTVAGASAPLNAQRAGATIDLVPSVGWFSPRAQLGTVTAEGAEVPLRQGAAMMMSLGVETPLAGRVSARGSVTFVPGSEITMRQPAGHRSCGPDCVRFVYDESHVATSRILLLSGAAMVRMPPILAVRPYVLGGAGIKRQMLSSEPGAEEPGALLSRERSDLTAQAGLGAELGTGRFVVRAEVVDHVSRYELAGASQREHGRLQHDLALQFGVRLRR